MDTPEYLSSEELAESYVKFLETKHKYPALFGLISTGYPRLDSLLGGGFEPGQLIFVGGGPKSGKTTLLASIAFTLCKAKEKGCIL